MTKGTPSARPDGHRAFGRYLKPRLLRLLRANGLDVVYHRAAGDVIYRRDATGEEVAVLDLLGGYGASLLGHNHPELVARLREMLDAQRPFNAQASVRALAGQLAERLSELVGASTGRSYVATLANSGTEAVEAAIKHAELEHVLRIDRIHERLRRTSRELRIRMREHTAIVPDELFDAVARRFDLARIHDLDELFGRVFRHNLDALDVEPRFLALEGAFHGKSTGALQLTHNPDYRSPWRKLGVRTTFLPVGDADALAAAIAAARVGYLDFEVSEHGALRLVERELVDISACFVEAIQGEAGIRVVGHGYLEALRAAADEGGFPLVIDEIQSGMGRTGTFLASAPSGVRGDYYLFSKSLGGGLVKVSALLVDRERAIAEYGWLHTSTFADDDLSSGVALAALEIVDRDDQALVRACAEKGAHLIARLEEVRARHPFLVREVRGRGLMVGIELALPKKSSSPLVRVMAEQDLLGFFLSGWLLHEAAIRTAPALSLHRTIRLEPSALVSTDDLDRFVDALDRVLDLVEAGDSFGLVRFLVGRAGEDAPSPPSTEPPFRDTPVSTAGWVSTRRRFSRNVAFLGHFLEPGDIRHWDPALAPLDDDDCGRFLDLTRRTLEPFVLDRAEVRSVDGAVVNLTVIGLAFTAEQVMAGFRKGSVDWAVELIEDGVEVAKRLGCSVVGFGGYTSILTHDCRDIIEDEITLTSGNSLTVAAAVEATRQASARLGLEAPRLGVLGAAGNIGAVTAAVAADEVADILLVGRPGAAGRLERVAAEVYFEAWKRLTREGWSGGVAGAIAGTRTIAELTRRGTAGVDRIGEAIRLGLIDELGADAVPVRIAGSHAALAECEVVVSATNAPTPVILPEHIREGPVVVCDVATPRDVSPEVIAARPDAVVLDGGVVRTPLGQPLSIGGMRLPSGQVYGCIAESILLGFAGIGENFSFGALTAARVRWVRELARLHGFGFAEHPAR